MEIKVVRNFGFLLICALIPLFGKETIMVLTTKLKLRNLPGQRDTFEHIRERKKIYVDKTKYISKLLDRDEKFYFISRPRRFGKSNFLQMLRAFFVGNESMFKGLDVPLDHNWNEHSVIYFNFAHANIDSSKKFLIDLSGVITRTGKSYGIKVNERRHFEFQLRELILDLSEGKPESVVILVDEYDRPIRKNVERGRNHAAKELNECLEDFFELLIGMVESLKLVMATGVMKYSSVVNNFCDITNDPQFCAAMGFTHEEVIYNFQDHIGAMAAEYREDFRNITEALKKKYNSYSFSPDNPEQRVPVLNPTSVISSFQFKKIDNYWYKMPSRMPDYIIKFFRENKLTTKYFHNTKVLKKTLEMKYDFDQQIPMEVYLILHGYLTFRGYDAENEVFTVGFPNDEVEETFLQQTLGIDPRLTITEEVAAEASTSIKTALMNCNTEEFIHQVDSLLIRKTQPFTQAITEEYPLTSLVESILRASAVDVESGLLLIEENEINPIGDIDIETLNLPTNYVLEFKWRKTAALAMNQLLKYANSTIFQTRFKGKAINLVGINFCLEKSFLDPRQRAKPVRMNDWIKVRYHDGVCSELEASHTRYLHIYESLTFPGTNCCTMHTAYPRKRLS